MVYEYRNMDIGMNEMGHIHNDTYTCMHWKWIVPRMEVNKIFEGMPQMHEMHW